MRSTVRATLVAVVSIVFVATCIHQAGGLTIRSYPHYQTFDSWPDCYYVGTCYELYCQSLKGGWYNPEFHPPVAPFTEEVRSWWVISGPTTSNLYANLTTVPCAQVETGPCYDHTQGGNNTRRGKYLYTEASACFGFLFRVNSPFMVFTNSSAKFSYWYFLHGIDMDRGGYNQAYLRSKISLDNGTTWTTLQNHLGPIQDSSTDAWLLEEIILDSFFPAPATPSAPVTAMFQFEAMAGGERNTQTFWKSDIAIDDVIFTQDGASNILVPYIDPPTNGTDSTGGGDGDGVSGGEIAGIVVGVIGGLGLLCCCLLLMLLLLLLLISPRGPATKGSRGAKPDGEGEEPAAEGADDL